MPVILVIDARDLNYDLLTVNINRIMPTQADLLPDVVDFYRRRVRMTDESGALPYGTCFAGSNIIYLTNGHHRWYVCKERGRQRLRMWVYHHPLTLRDAVLKVFTPSPVPTKPARRQSVSPRQMSLAF